MRVRAAAGARAHAETRASGARTRALPGNRPGALPAVLTPALATAWRREYAHGSCHALTVALAEALDCETAWLCVGTTYAGETFPVHSCLAPPARTTGSRAHDVGLDIAGWVTLDDLRRRYRVRPQRSRRRRDASSDDGLRALDWTRVPITRIVALVGADTDELALALDVVARLPHHPSRAAAWAYLQSDVFTPEDRATYVLDGPIDADCWGEG